MPVTTAPHAPGANGFAQMAAEPVRGAHGCEVLDVGSTLYETLKRKTGGFVSPFGVGHVGGDDPKRYSRGMAFDFGAGGVQIRPFGHDNPHEPNSEPPPPVVLQDGRILQPVIPDQPSGAPPAPVLTPTSAMDVQTPAMVGSLTHHPIPAGPASPLQDTKNVDFVTDIGKFTFRCVSATVSESMWLTLLGNNLPKVEAGKRFNIVIDGQTHRCYSPGINVDIQVGPYRVGVSHYLIEADEEQQS